MNFFKFLAWGTALAYLSACAVSKHTLIGGATLLEIAESRTAAMEDGTYLEKTTELLLLRKNNARILKKLAERLEEEKVPMGENRTAYLVDFIYANPIDFSHEGLLWNSDFYIRYRFDLKKKRITFFELEKDFGKYPRKQAGIPFKLMKFLEGVGSEDDFKNVPMTGRTGSGHCIFSRIEERRFGIVKSYAFWQY